MLPQPQDRREGKTGSGSDGPGPRERSGSEEPLAARWLGGAQKEEEEAEGPEERQSQAQAERPAAGDPPPSGPAIRGATREVKLEEEEPQEPPRRRRRSVVPQEGENSPGLYRCSTCQDWGCEECSGCDRCGGVVGEGPFLEDRGPDHPRCWCPPLGMLIGGPATGGTDAGMGPPRVGTPSEAATAACGTEAVPEERSDEGRPGGAAGGELTDSVHRRPGTTGATGATGAVPMRLRSPVLTLRDLRWTADGSGPGRAAPRF